MNEVEKLRKIMLDERRPDSVRRQAAKLLTMQAEPAIEADPATVEAEAAAERERIRALFWEAHLRGQ